MQFSRVFAFALVGTLASFSLANAQNKESFLDKAGISFDSIQDSLGWKRKGSPTPAQPVAQRRSVPQRANNVNPQQQQLNADQRRQMVEARRTQEHAQRQIQAMESGLAQAKRSLDQQLARANELRARGLKANDGKILKQAEQVERQAMQTYEATIKRFESGKVIAPRTNRNRTPKRPQPTSRPTRRWGLFGF